MKNAQDPSPTGKHITPGRTPWLMIVLAAGACMIFVILISKKSNLSTVMAVAFVLVWIPVFLLTARDFLARKKAALSSEARVRRAFYSGPDILLGSFSLVFGLMMIMWVLYNVFVRRLSEYTGPSTITSLGSFGIGVPLFLYGLHRLRNAMRSDKLAKQDSTHESD